MAAMAEGQRDVFVERLKRIEKGGPNTIGELLIGPGDVEGPKLKKQRKKLRLGWLGDIAIMPFAAALGAVAMLSGRVGAYHLTQPGAEGVAMVTSDAMILMTDIGIALTLALALAWCFKLGRGLRLVALVAGFLGVMLFEAQLIEQAPDAFVALFSETYVSAMTTELPRTVPGT
ncbi:MAG: hypothetical protein HKO95_10985 [Rhodobacteraceae bacterium]|nr:hypothetical protein [Alphaproteobacteria bacterium]NNF71363.1 hypothetical protein [Paracoccaceae bacterium]NNK67250.1 hypothetical protein [Paracoccaceae bacterium]